MSASIDIGTSYQIRLVFPDGTDREAVYEFYRKNADSLISERCVVGLNHQAYSLFYFSVLKPEEYNNINMTIPYIDGTIAVCSNGTVVSDCIMFHEDPVLNELRKWNDISYITNGSGYVAGLHGDGTVTAFGDNIRGECNVQKWQHIVAIACGNRHTVGLRANGTVAATGEASCCATQNWDNIISIGCGNAYTAGLCADGTVVFVGYGDHKAQKKVQEWKNIISIACGPLHIVGLCADGTVVAAGNRDYGQCAVKDWRNVVAISCAPTHTVGLCADGTVVATGSNSYYNECDVKSFRDIIAVKAIGGRTVAVQKDGRVIATNWTSYKKNYLGLVSTRAYKPLPPWISSFKLF